jgi:hypothetical protein
LLHDPVSYGTLQQEAVQMSTFGSLLQGQPDEPVGFEQWLLQIEDPQFVAASGRTHHAIVRFNGRNDSRVHGTVFEVSASELASADRYEPRATAAFPRRLLQGNRPGCTLTRAIGR